MTTTEQIRDVGARWVEAELAADVDTLGDGVNQNDVPFQNDFPYVAYPHHGSDPSPH